LYRPYLRFDGVTNLRAAHVDRTDERLVSARGILHALESSEELGWNFLFRYAEFLEVFRVAGRCPQPHDVARVYRQYRLLRRIEIAVMHRCRHWMDLVNLLSVRGSNRRAQNERKNRHAGNVDLHEALRCRCDGCGIQNVPGISPTVSIRSSIDQERYAS